MSICQLFFVRWFSGKGNLEKYILPFLPTSSHPFTSPRFWHKKTQKLNPRQTQPTWRIIAGLGYTVINHGLYISPQDLGFWDPFLWLINGGDSSYLQVLGWSLQVHPKHWISKHLHSLKLTARTWKSKIGRRSFWGKFDLFFRSKLAVSFRECNPLQPAMNANSHDPIAPSTRLHVMPLASGTFLDGFFSRISPPPWNLTHGYPKWPWFGRDEIPFTNHRNASMFLCHDSLNLRLESQKQFNYQHIKPSFFAIHLKYPGCMHKSGFCCNSGWARAVGKIYHIRQFPLISTMDTHTHTKMRRMYRIFT